MVRRQTAGKVLPGEIVIFTNVFLNTGAEPVDHLVVTNPVPGHMEYLGGSASDTDAEVIFSVDDGKTFDHPGKLAVKNPDGSHHTAAPAEYTHIRWRLNKTLAPKQEGKVEFRCKLK